jgi:hypothetical protein
MEKMEKYYDSVYEFGGISYMSKCKVNCNECDNELMQISASNEGAILNVAALAIKLKWKVRSGKLLCPKCEKKRKKRKKNA